MVNSSLSGGGSERAMVNLANYLNRNDYEVIMILVRVKNKVYAIDDNVKVIQLDNQNQYKIRTFLSRIIGIRKVIKKYPGSNLISFMTDINFFTIVSSFGLNKKKLIVSERNNPKALKGKKKILYKSIEKFFYRYATDIVFQTQFVKKLYPLKTKKKAHVIPNMVEVDSNLRNKADIENNIVAVGRLNNQKNFPLLIKAFSEVVKSYPDLKLDIYGEGVLEKKLKDQAKELSLQDSIRFHGFQKEIQKKIAKAKLYVSTSNFEGISNAMLEALALGIPSICSDCPVGGASLAIDSGYNGFLFPVNDCSMLIKLINAILSDNDKYETISQNASQSMKRFSPVVIGEEWEELLK